VEKYFIQFVDLDKLYIPCHDLATATRLLRKLTTLIVDLPESKIKSEVFLEDV
jgi:hypothetical protein